MVVFRRQVVAHAHLRPVTRARHRTRRPHPAVSDARKERAETEVARDKQAADDAQQARVEPLIGAVPPQPDFNRAVGAVDGWRAAQSAVPAPKRVRARTTQSSPARKPASPPPAKAKAPARRRVVAAATLTKQDALPQRTVFTNKRMRMAPPPAQKAPLDQDKAARRPRRMRDEETAWDAKTAHAIREMKKRLTQLVQAEAAAEEKQVERLYADRDTQRLRDKGLLLDDLLPASQGLLYDKAVIKLSRHDDKPLPRHGFKQGETGLLSFESQQGRAADNVTVLHSTSDAVHIEMDCEASERVLACFKKLAREAEGQGRMRLDSCPRDNVTTRRQLEALDVLDNVMDATNKFEVAVRRVLVCHPEAASIAALENRWARNQKWRKAADTALAGLIKTGTLNKSQADALKCSMTRIATLWQGPPGTGKTKTLVALMRVFIFAGAACDEPTGPVLAASDTNASADFLALAAREAGLRAVRVGNPASVAPNARHLCIAALAERTPKGREAKRLRLDADKHLRELEHQRVNSAHAELAARQDAEQRRVRQQAMEMRKRASTLERDARATVLSNAHVVAGTCASSSGADLAGQKFRMVIVDEAAQATEASTLLPLVRGAECFVLAGDQMQLPPTVLSLEARSGGLCRTLFEALQERKLWSALLQEQYRMHPAIAEFSSLRFYDGRIVSGVKEIDRPAPKGLDWPSTPRCAPDGTVHWASAPVVLINAARHLERPTRSNADPGQAHAGRSHRQISERSYCNHGEAALSVRAACTVAHSGDVDSIAILTPYRGQVRAIESYLSQHGGSLRNGDNVDVEVRVSTVDGFQGREADVVVFSATRNNSGKRLGFVRDVRRLNVALTRARRGLIVVASPAMLQADPVWSEWLDWVRDNAAIVEEEWISNDCALD